MFPRLCPASPRKYSPSPSEPRRKWENCQLALACCAFEGNSFQIHSFSFLLNPCRAAEFLQARSPGDPTAVGKISSFWVSLSLAVLLWVFFCWDVFLAEEYSFAEEEVLCAKLLISANVVFGRTWKWDKWGRGNFPFQISTSGRFSLFSLLWLKNIRSRNWSKTTWFWWSESSQHPAICYLPFLQREKRLEAFLTGGKIWVLHDSAINVTEVIPDIFC